MVGNAMLNRRKIVVDGNKAPKKSNNHSAGNKDPSILYIADPTKSPIVKAAKKYFNPILQD